MLMDITMLQCISAAFKKEAPGEGFEPPCAMHRRYPVLRFRGVRLGPSLAIPTCKVGISSIIIESVNKKTSKY